MRAELHRAARLAVPAGAVLRIAENGRGEHAADHALADAIRPCEEQGMRQAALAQHRAQRLLLLLMT